MPKKRKFPKRKRQFNLHTKEGRLQSEHNQKLFDAFPNETDRMAYLKACIAEFDRTIELCQE